MSVANKDVVQRLYNQVWNERKLELADQIISKSHALLDPTSSGAAVGPEAYKRVMRRFFAALPDLRFTVEEFVSEKDKVVAVWTISGTHKGELFGIAPTNKKIALNGMTIHQVADGKILDSQAVWDALNLFQQMGVTLPVKQDKQAASTT